jgi:predicted membrane-bound dolichyl-phosphate-mannose-protein mannosyltransferase
MNMNMVERFWRRLLAWRYLGLALLVAATAAMHLSIINQPADFMVDEVYYVKDARAIVSGEGELRPEHPPLGQLLIAAGIYMFGDNPFGWRFLSVVFGSFGIVFFYLVCGRLGMSRRTAFLASFLFAFENMSFVQASIAMLDVFSVTFMLAAFWLYLRGNSVTAAVAICLSTLCKLTGGLALPVIGLHWLLTRRDRPVRFMVSLAIAPLLFTLTIPLFDYIMTGEMYDPITRISEILSVSSSITFTDFTNLYASRPWEWVLRPEVMPYYWDPQYVSAVSFTVGALVIPTAILMTVLARRGNEVGLFGVSWFALTYVSWIPLSLITDRMSYVFYFYPSVGAICLGLGWAVSALIDYGRSADSGKRRRLAIVAAVGYLQLAVPAG